MASFLKFHLFQMKYMLGIQDIRYRIRTTSGLIPKLFALFIPLLILAGIVLAPYMLILYFCYKFIDMAGSPETYISLVLFLGQVLILFFSLISSFTAMFGRKDHEFLSALPIPKRYVYMSSVLHVYVSGVLSAALVLIPSVIIYGMGQGFSLQMILMTIPAVLLAPVLPVCIAFAFVLLIMRLVIDCPFKEQLTTVFGIVFLIGYMVFNFSFSSKFGAWIASMDFAGLFEHSGWFSDLLKVLPGVYLTRLTLIGSASEAFLAFLEILLISAVLFIGMYFVGGKSFFSVRAALTMHANRKQTKLRYKESRPFWAYMKKEYRGILRCSVYVLNGLLGMILGPVMVIFMMSGRGIDSAGLMGELLAQQNERFLMIPVLIILGIAHFMVSSISSIPASSYSREGLSRWVTQVAPVSDKTDFLGRAFASLVLFWLSDLLTWGLGWYYFRFSLFDGLFFMFALLISAIPCVFITLFVDYKRPKLVWEKEAQAMKQNVNVMIGMLLSWFISVICLLPLFLYVMDCFNRIYCLILTLALPIGLAIASVVIILNKLNRRIVV